MILLAIVYSIKFFAGGQHGGTGISVAEAWMIFPYTLIFNVACFVLSITCGNLTRLSIRDALTIAIEFTLHNINLGLLIAGILLHNQEMVKPALVYSMFSFWSTIIFGIITKLFHKDKWSYGNKDNLNMGQSGVCLRRRIFNSQRRFSEDALICYTLIMIVCATL
jgi:BASS family bile acid:Na+ symporter